MKMMGDKRISNYETGYGKLPRHTRFQKGRSGNPKGRPRGSKNSATLLMEALHEPVIISENGRRKKITKQQAIVKQIVNKAASGDHRSIQLLLVNQIPLIEELLDKVNRENNLKLEQRNPMGLETLETQCKLMRDTVRVLRDLNVAVAPELADDAFWDLPGKE
jgi:hypothetical protein